MISHFLQKFGIREIIIKDKSELCASSLAVWIFLAFILCMIGLIFKTDVLLNIALYMLIIFFAFITFGLIGMAASALWRGIKRNIKIVRD